LIQINLILFPRADKIPGFVPVYYWAPATAADEAAFIAQRVHPGGTSEPPH
jgi:hypothetical protein